MADSSVAVPPIRYPAFCAQWEEARRHPDELARARAVVRALVGKGTRAQRSERRRDLAAIFQRLRGTLGCPAALDRWRWVTLVRSHRRVVADAMRQLQKLRDEAERWHTGLEGGQYSRRARPTAAGKLGILRRWAIPDAEQRLQALLDRPIQPYRQWWRAAVAHRRKATMPTESAAPARGRALEEAILAAAKVLRVIAENLEGERERFSSEHAYDRWSDEVLDLVEQFEAKAEELPGLLRPASVDPDAEAWLRRQLEGLAES